MNAQQVAERSAVYALQDAMTPVAGDAFELMATAPQGVAKLRELILALALHGQLVRQDPADESAETLLASSRRKWAKLMAEGAIKRERPATPVAATEQRFPLPPNWTWCRVVDTAQYVNGLAFKPSDWGKVGRSIIRIQNLSGRNVDFHRTDKEVDPSVVVKSGDILVSWSATLDVFIWTGEDGVLNQHIFRVTPSPLVNQDFLYWLLKGVIRELAASDHAHGLVMSHINRGPFLAHPVAIPPLAEQRRIVARVEELMGLCDELEAHGRLQDEQHARLVATVFDALVASTSSEELADNWQRIANHFDLLLDRPEAVDALEQAALQLAVRGLLVPQDPADEPASALLNRIRAEKVKLIAKGVLSAKKREGSGDEHPIDELPHGWVSSSLAEIGIINPRNVAPDGLLASFIPMSAVPIKLMESHTSEQRQWSEINTGFTHFAEGDVGVAKITPCFENGKSTVFRNLTNGIGAGTTELHIVRPLGGVVPEYVLLFLKSPRFLKNGETVMTGTAGQKRLPKSYFEATPFPLAPLDEQRRIVARVKLLFGYCANLRQYLQQAQATQSHLADALAARAVA